jgi:hypothetical protein
MNKYYTKGRKLPALEQNILKYRAFEMVIILFHIEELKSFVLKAVRATDEFLHPKDVKQHRLPPGTKKKYEKMWALLVLDGIITQEESNDIQEIIDYRNQIAHRIQNLTYDISNEAFSEDYIQFKGVKYDYEALKRLEVYRDKINRGLSRKYILTLGFNSLLFESAEYTYRRELERLEKRIRRLLAIRNDEISAIKSELSTINKDFIIDIQPYHPDNVLPNGKLSKRGIDCCYTLFKNGLSDLAVSHLMRIYYASVSKRRKRWDREKNQSHVNKKA